VVGAGVGAAIVDVWNQSLAAQRRTCQGAAGLCIGPNLAGFAAGALIVVTISAAGLALLRVRPLLISVPAVLAMTCLMVISVDHAIPGGNPPPAWLAASLLAAGYGAVCVTVTSSGWARKAALALIALMIAVGIAVPYAVHDAIQRRHQLTSIRDLGFGPMIPEVSGYKVADAYPDSGTLVIDMVAVGARRDQFGAYENIAFTVTLGTAASEYLDALRTRCQAPASGNTGGGPCQMLRPGLWAIRPALGRQELAIAVHGPVIAAANPGVQLLPIAVLANAVTDLRRVSASRLLSFR
jgi:hypothetical protein